VSTIIISVISLYSGFFIAGIGIIALPRLFCYFITGTLAPAATATFSQCVVWQEQGQRVLVRAQEVRSHIAPPAAGTPLPCR
jgi:hypothetical protein